MLFDWEHDETRTAACKVRCGPKRQGVCPQCPNIEPPIIEENLTVWSLYKICRSQVIMGACGMVGINMPAWFAVAEKMGMELQEWDINKMKLLENKLLLHQQEISDRD